MNSSPFRCDDRIRSVILEAADATGACAAGFVAVTAVSSRSTEIYRDWIAQGRHGGMVYLEKYAEVRDNPAMLLDGAQSILCLAFAYRSAHTPRHPLFADYALGEDYHEVLRKHLAPVASLMEQCAEGSHTRICVDTAPLRERYWAVKAGLGYIGLNNQLIIPGKGSAVFLAEILWTASVTPSEPCAVETCLQCRRCVEACPGAALDGNGGLDARRCLSYLTIEHRGAFPDGFSLAGRKIYGCDICRDVCPLGNAGADLPVLGEFIPDKRLMSLTEKDVSDMSQDEFSQIFRHSAIKRTKLAGLLRNSAAASSDKTILQ